MNTELSSNSDFSLPEYYFRIYRQEDGNTGKFFSHIERVPWEDMQFYATDTAVLCCVVQCSVIQVNVVELTYMTLRQSDD